MNPAFVRGACAALALAAGHAGAQTAPAAAIDYGRAEYVARCASCHGPTGTGDGHFREFLNRAPTDLTTIARANGGVFPFQRVYEAIDGRRLVAGHGRAGEMPVWGAAYLAEGRHDPAVGPARAAQYAHDHIRLLVDYVSRLQKK